MGCNLLIHHMHMFLLIGSAILFTNQAHFLSPHENQPQPHRSSPGKSLPIPQRCPLLIMTFAKVRVQQKRAKLAKSFKVRNFCRLQRPGTVTLYRNSRLRPPDKVSKEIPESPASTISWSLRCMWRMPSLIMQKVVSSTSRL